MSIKVWNIENTANIKIASGHNRGVSAVALSCDLRFLVSGSWD